MTFENDTLFFAAKAGDAVVNVAATAAADLPRNWRRELADSWSLCPLMITWRRIRGESAGSEGLNALTLANARRTRTAFMVVD